ncbi:MULTISPECIES: hypothetical protein [Streptomyces]|nr:hypothetical protein [Streptomyces viridochromogenes]
MTDTTPPPMPAAPPPVPPARKQPRNWVVIGSAAAVIAAVIGTGVYVVNAEEDDSKPASVSKSSSPDDDTVTAAADAPDPEPTYTEVDADSFTIKLRTTEKQCFGSAGCNVTVEPELIYLGVSGDINPDAVYDITYEIRGDESGTVIETAELSNQTSLNYSETAISTASRGATVSVKITGVTERGY